MTKYQPVKGTRIIKGDEFKERSRVIDGLIKVAHKYNFEGVLLPTMDYSHVYTDKLDKDLRMFHIPDINGRENKDMVLRPECTNTISSMDWPKNTMIWYCQSCFRYDNPQKGRWREFTQFGVEIINPTTPKSASEFILQSAAMDMMVELAKNFNAMMIQPNIDRGSDYYIDGNGFEWHDHSLGSASQIIGGGEYKNGMGFAVGVDRLLLSNKEYDEREN